MNVFHRHPPLLSLCVILTVLLTAIVLLIAGCSRPGSHSGAALATSTAAADAKAIVAKCVPASGLAQAREFTAVVHDTAGKPDGPRARLMNCLGVSPDNRQLILGDIITAAEHVKWSDKTARLQFRDETIPGIITRYANIPGVSVSPTAVPS